MKFITLLLIYVSIYNLKQKTTPTQEDNIQSQAPDPAKTWKQVIDLSKTPAHQDIIPNKKLMTKYEVFDVKGIKEVEDEWDYVDQGRNWGWTCLFGLKQSPINIPYEKVYRSRWDSNKTTLRFHLKPVLPAVKVKLTHREMTMEINDAEGGKNPNFKKLRSKAVPIADKKDNFGQVVIHPGFSPKTALSYTAYRFQFKTPSEHLIDMAHYPIEMQLEHHLDLIKSLIWPENALHSHIPRKMVLSFMFTKGGLNPLLNKIFDDKKTYIREERGGQLTLSREKAPFITGAPLESTIPENKILMEDLFHTATRGLEFSFRYAMYEGSMPMPPCQEDTQWIVILDPVQASLRQLQFVDSLFNIKPSRHIQLQNNRWITQGTYNSADIVDTIDYNVIKDKEFKPVWMPALIKNKYQGDQDYGKIEAKKEGRF